MLDHWHSGAENTLDEAEPGNREPVGDIRGEQVAEDLPRSRLEPHDEPDYHGSGREGQRGLRLQGGEQGGQGGGERDAGHLREAGGQVLVGEDDYGEHGGRAALPHGHRSAGDLRLQHEEEEVHVQTTNRNSSQTGQLRDELQEVEHRRLRQDHQEGKHLRGGGRRLGISSRSGYVPVCWALRGKLPTGLRKKLPNQGISCWLLGSQFSNKFLPFPIEILSLTSISPDENVFLPVKVISFYSPKETDLSLIYSADLQKSSPLTHSISIPRGKIVRGDIIDFPISRQTVLINPGLSGLPTS